MTYHSEEHNYIFANINPDTQYEHILKYIMDFGSISPMEAFSDLGITKLATRISEMWAKGWAFEHCMEQSKNRYGKPVRYVRYKNPRFIGSQEYFQSENDPQTFEEEEE